MLLLFNEINTIIDILLFNRLWMLDNAIVAIITFAYRHRYLQFICNEEKFIYNNIVL